MESKTPRSKSIALESGHFPDAAGLERATETLRLLANGERLKILCHLSLEGEMSVGQLLERATLSQSALSQHLAKFRKAGVLSTRKEHQTVYYSIGNDDVLKVLRLMQDLYCASP